VDNGLPAIAGRRDSRSAAYSRSCSERRQILDVQARLLRAIAKIADNAPSMARPTLDNDRVEIPLGLIALNWVRMYQPLVTAGLPQAPGNSGPDGLSFAKAGFRSLTELGVAAQELRPGAIFSKERFAAVVSAISEARNTIANMPVRYITLPNSTRQVFDVTSSSRGHRSGGTLTAEVLQGWGTLSAPGPLWRTMQRLGAWIEPLLLAEWSRIMKSYAVRMGLDIPPGTVETWLQWIEPSRDTALARSVAARLRSAGKHLICTWSRTPLSLGDLDIDHALPWSAWPCSDLWNLLPAARRVNQHQKRERLPSAAALAKAREPILDWWREAWISEPILSQRFEIEARVALPIEGSATLENVFAGLEWRRLRVQQDQQAPEWAGVRV
jgi:hypothetical protein